MGSITLANRRRPLSVEFSEPQETLAWGDRFAPLLKNGDVIALVGELGSGKTTLVQGIVTGRGYERLAISPTFALANEYRSGDATFFHLDLYRLTPVELAGFPLEEYFDRQAICFVEWADRVRRRWPAETLEIQLEFVSSRKRRLTILSPSDRWAARVQPLFTRAN